MTGPLIVLSGPPGAGKSTVSRELAHGHPKAVHLHTDDFWRYIVSGGVAPYEPEAAAQNHLVVDVIAGAAFTYADGGFTTIVDGVIGPWMLHHFQDQARHHLDVSFHFIVLRPNRLVTLGRAQRRTELDALTREGPVMQMWQQFADLGTLERHVLDTSGEDPHATVASVMSAVASGRMVVRPSSDGSTG